MSTVPSPESSSAPTPPTAKQVPTERTHHGDTVTDPYAWLADPKDPEVIAYLEAENGYTDTQTEHLGRLRSAVFDEIKARTQETDLSVPVRKGNWWRYSRTEEGKQYAISCRRLVRDGEVTPPMPENGKPLDGEEVLLDGNVLAEGKEIADVCRELQVSEQTYYRWRNQFGGLKADDVKRLKDLERENATLKRLLAEAELEKAALKEIAQGNF